MTIVWKWSLNWNANDSAGSNNWVSTNITWVDWKMNWWASFNWTNSYISIPDFNYNLPTSFTYNAWIKVNNYSDANWIIQHDKWSWPTSRWTLFRTDITTWFLNFIRLNSAWSVITNLISPSALWTWTWKMVTATFDNTIWSKIFINWVLVASDTVLINTNDCTAPIWIWTLDVSVWTQNAMDWLIDEIIIDNTAWNNAQIKNQSLYYNWFI